MDAAIVQSSPMMKSYQNFAKLKIYRINVTA
jgi:hypothetical protein